MVFCTISSRFLHFMHFQYIFLQEFYPSPSVSDRFCTISSGCYRIFLHFHCIFPACLLHRRLFLAVAPVSSMFQQILHPLFWLLSHFPARLLSHFPSLYLSSIFQWILHDFLWLLSCFPAVSISSSWVSVYSCIFKLFFQDFYPSPFSTSSSGLLHFQCIFPRVLPVSFIFRSFLHHFLWLLSHFPALSLSFSNMFTASS